MLAPKQNNHSKGSKPNNHVIRKPLIQKKQYNKSGIVAEARPTLGGGKAVFGKKGSYQTKLKVGSPNDKFEKEADNVADQVVSKSAEPNVQKAPAPPIQTMKVSSTDLQRMSEPEEEVQKKAEEEEVQMKSTSSLQRKEIGSDEDESVQMKEDDVEMSDDELVSSDQEVQTKRDFSIQRKEAGTDEDESVQLKEDDVEMSDDELVSSDQEVQTKRDFSIQRQETGTEEDESVQLMSEDDSEVQMMSEEEDVQAKLKDAPTPPKNNVGSTLQSTKGGGQKMDSTTKSTMESGFGHDLSNVNIHTDSRAANMNKELGAKAFTNGADIYFNDGEYRPDTEDGKKLLAHELTHTLQQGAVDKKLPQTTEEAGAVSDESSKATANQGETPEAEQKSPEELAAQDPEAAKKEGEEAGKEGEEEKAEEEEKKKPDPKNDPNFQEVMGNIAVETDKQKPKDDPDTLGENALEAAVSPDNEADSFAMADQVDEMEQQEPVEFSAETFKSMLKERIKDMQLPENNEEAEDFENNNNIDKVNKAATKDVKGETEKTSAGIDQSTNKEPEVKPEHKREAEELNPAKKGKKPKKVSAEKAVPPTRPVEEMEKPLADDTKRIDNRMAENEVTDHQLAISNEPKFEQALDEKHKAKEESGAMAASLRVQESTVQQQNAEKAKALSDEELQGMQALNHGAVKKVTGDQKTTGDKDTAERDKVAGEINQIYEDTKKDVNEILDNLDAKVEKDFEYASNVAKYKFEKYVDRKFAIYKARRYSGPLGGARWVKDLFVGLPDEVNEYFVEGRKLFTDTMDAYIDRIAVHIAKELNRATQRIEDGKQKVNEHVENLPKHLKKFGKEAASEIQDKFDELSSDVEAKQEDLVDMLAEEYVAALEEVDERIEEMKAANRGLVDMVMDFIDGVIETIRKLKEAIMGLLSAIASAISVIMADPIGFMGTLFDGISKGIDMFKANIQKHLLGGLLEWLTGAMGPMGITVPDDIFSLSGIFDLVMQVLGLGWSQLRLKAVKSMGEPVVQALETSWDMFKTFSTKGVMGIWEYVKDKFQDLKATVIDAIKEMLITKVIEAGIKWLLSLLIPGAGFIKAIMAIKDIIVFFVESAIMLIPAITEAILALAAGNIAGVAKAFEFGLAKLITLVIGLFARLIGLNGLAKRVTKIFKKLKKRIAKAMRKLMQKAKRAGRKIMRKLGLGKKEKPKNKEQHDEQVKAGLAYIDQLSNAEDKDKDGNIDQEAAHRIAKKTKSKFKVFTSVKPVLDNGIWVYDWTGSKGRKTSKKGGGQKKLLKGSNAWKDARLKLIPNGETKLTDAELKDYNEAQIMANNQILKKGASYGDGTSAFIAMLEQHKAGPGNSPIPIVGNTKHESKAKETLAAIDNKIKSLNNLPTGAKDELLNQRQKILDALNWIKAFNNNQNPKLPSWAKGYSDLFD